MLAASHVNIDFLASLTTKHNGVPYVGIKLMLKKTRVQGKCGGRRILITRRVLSTQPYCVLPAAAAGGAGGGARAAEAVASGGGRRAGAHTRSLLS